METRLKIVRRGWTGWQPEQPKPDEPREVTLSENGSEILEDPLARGVVKVKEIKDDSVLFEVSELARRDSSGTDLNSAGKPWEVKVKNKENFQAATPTLDGGSIYEITVLDIN